MNAPTWALLLAGWMLVGGGVGLALHRRGHPLPTALAASVAWPMLLDLFGETPGGPFAARIAAVLAPLRGLVAAEEIESLRASLRAADAWVARADALLEPTPAGDPAWEPLRAARVRAVGEMEAVLAEIVRLRVQVGLMDLQADAGAARARLGELRARVRVLEEIGR